MPAVKIYLSSTYADLKRHRAVVARALEKADYQVEMMEKYVARDQLVEFACRGDVAACDVYVGIFAWRYGHIPEDDNPQRLSVTEMEYAAAGAKPMTRLTFLLDDQARWPQARKDADPGRIAELRARLKKRCSAYFSSAEQLAFEVLAALRVHQNTLLASRLEAMDIVLRSQDLGSSLMQNIRDKLPLLGEVAFVALPIAPLPWWSTRLHLVASLAQDFRRVRGMAFVDAAGRYLLTATPAEIRYRLASRWPALETSYEELRRSAGGLDQVAGELWRYPQMVGAAFGTDEQQAKHVLSVADLTYEFGIARIAEVVDTAGKGTLSIQREALGRQTPYVALVNDGSLLGLVDRDALARNVADAALAHLP